MFWSYIEIIVASSEENKTALEPNFSDFDQNNCAAPLGNLWFQPNDEHIVKQDKLKMKKCRNRAAEWSCKLRQNNSICLSA